MRFGKTMLSAAVAGLLITGTAGLAWSAAPAKAKATTAAADTKPWTTGGGDVAIRWNYDLARDLGIEISPAGVRGQRASDGAERFEAGGEPLRFRVENGYLRAFLGGSVQARGGYTLALARGGAIDMDGFRIVPQHDDAGTFLRLDIVDAKGEAWFYVNRVMHEVFTGDDAALTISSSDIRISKALAQRIGQPFAADWYIGEFQADLPVAQRGGGEAGATGTASRFKWHGEAAPDGGTYQTDLFMLDTFAQYLRCRGCTGNDGTGELVITPSSTLKNNVNNGTLAATVPGDPLGTSSALWTAGVPWYQKFTGPFAPYDNDQHPYLIWNMYRLAADGSIEQIGRSGIKQAYLTTNGGCLESNDHDSHVLGRGCTDTYSVGNNDYTQGMSPRSELMPAQGIWGRCGSTFDVNCDGAMNNQPGDEYTHRMTVREQQISPTANPGATWLYESWYLARQDIDIYNSMSTLVTTQTRSGSAWNVQSSQERLGSAIDRWFAMDASPRPPKLTRLSRQMHEIVVDNAHAKVAVKVRALPDGTWRYDYAVMNFDFAFGTMSGTNPNIRVEDNQGFDGFTVSTRSGAAATPTFRDGDVEAGNDWAFTADGDSAGWRDAAGAPNSLWWGGLYSFTLISPKGPTLGTATLHASNAPTPVSYSVETIVPRR